MMMMVVQGAKFKMQMAIANGSAWRFLYLFGQRVTYIFTLVVRSLIGQRVARLVG